MGEIRAIIGKLSAGAVGSELRRAIVTKKSGVLRLRAGRTIGAIWTVRGEVAHALHVEDGNRAEGSEAFDRLIYLDSGTFYWEEDTLPPARTIRLPIPEIETPANIVEANVADDDIDVAYNQLAEWQTDLKARVPGLTLIQIVELSHSQMRREPVNLNMIRTDDHLHLSVRVGRANVHLDATADTAPEAMLWAGEVMRRKLSEANPAIASVQKTQARVG